METKLSFVVAAIQSGDYRRAVSLASKFPRLGASRGAILDAYMAYSNPSFAAQLGKDVEALKLAGLVAIRSRYSL